MIQNVGSATLNPLLPLPLSQTSAKATDSFGSTSKTGASKQNTDGYSISKEGKQAAAQDTVKTASIQETLSQFLTQPRYTVTKTSDGEAKIVQAKEETPLSENGLLIYAQKAYNTASKPGNASQQKIQPKISITA